MTRIHDNAVPARLVGSAPSLQRVMEIIERLGNSNVGVLVHGESGTGKELAARAIYNVRKRGPFIPIDCGALPGNLIESELFGYERGAFTGAAVSREGLLRAAAGGTAFFDEIGELPLDSQAKLLRVLQSQEIRPVGAVSAKPCSFRVIAATNRDLEQEVREGRFRLDLFYRLNVVTLTLPPLRDRLEDIPELVEHVLHKFGYPHRVPDELLSALRRHQWPGNVRELENCIARLATLSSDDALQLSDLPPHFHAASGAPSGPLELPLQAPSGTSIADAEKAAIERALSAANGSQTDAARALGIGRTTLYRKLKSFEQQSKFNRSGS